MAAPQREPAVNWILGTVAICLWLGATLLYFRRDLTRRWTQRRKRLAAAKAAPKITRTL